STISKSQRTRYFVVRKSPTRFLDHHRFLIFAEEAAEGVGDFADGGVGFDGGEDGGEKIFVSGGPALELGKRGLYAGRIAAGTQSFEASDLRALDCFVDARGGGRAFFLSNEVVDADDDLLFFLNGALKFERHFLNFSLNKTGFDGAQHSSERVDLGDVLFGAAFDFVREMFDGVR